MMQKLLTFIHTTSIPKIYTHKTYTDFIGFVQFSSSSSLVLFENRSKREEIAAAKP